jgi:hypothetical protein
VQDRPTAATATAPRPSASPAPVTVPDLAGLLRGRLGELTDRVVDRILEAEPIYGRITSSRHELHASVRENLAQFVDKLVDPRAETLGYLTFLTGVGRRRVEQGLPLDSLLHAFRIGARALWEMLREEAEARGLADVPALADAATAIWDHHEAVSARIATAYREAELGLLRRREAERQALVDGLLAGRGAEPAFAREAAFVLRLRPDGRFVVLVAEPLPGADARADPLPGVERRLAGFGLTSAWHIGPPRTVGIVDLGRADLPSVARAVESVANGRVGLSTPVDAFAALAGALQLAEAAFASLPADAPGVAVLTERLPAALVASAPQVAAVLVAQLLGPLGDLSDEERSRLLETLEAYTATGGSATEAALRIHCHRNTVLKRLRAYEAATGRDLGDPGTVLELTLALIAATALGLRDGCTVQRMRP